MAGATAGASGIQELAVTSIITLEFTCTGVKEANVACADGLTTVSDQVGVGVLPCTHTDLTLCFWR